MDTETVIESNLSISVNYNGVSPIGGGRMSFSPNHLTRIAPTNDNTFVKRIVFADLVTSGIYKVFQIVYGDGFYQDHSGNLFRNPAGEVIAYSENGRFLYIKPNTTAYPVAVSIPVPGSITANGALLLDSTFSIEGPDNGDSVLTLRFLTADLTAIGNANFYCDLIFAFY
jgi:hypothetical protein